MISKRLFDIIASLIGLVLFSPFALLIALLIKLASQGPIVYLQKRIGKNAELFTCIKFRTMYTGSEKQGSVTALSDARITVLGKFLRRYKLDELPQLWNVLIGKMSFVGPRPDVPGDAEKLVGDDRRILTVLPGITGPSTLYFRYEEAILAQVGNPKEYNDTVIWPFKGKTQLRPTSAHGISGKISGISLLLFSRLQISCSRLIGRSTERACPLTNTPLPVGEVAASAGEVE